MEILLGDYWDLIMHGTWISWIIVITTWIIVFIIIYFYRFFLYLTMYILCSIGLYVIVSHIDLTLVQAVIDSLHEHIQNITKE